MPAYSFMAQFVPDVESGLKTHTLRNKRKRPTVVGDLLSLYYAQRTSQCRLLLKSPCKHRYDASITEENIFIDHKRVQDCDAFARSDGFKDFRSMVAFWKVTHSLPWCGELISWGKKDPVEIFCK